MCHAAFGGVSGGTIESGIGLMKEPSDVRKKAEHPYAFDPDNWDKPLSDVPDKGMRIAPLKLPLAQVRVAATAPLQAAVMTSI